MPASALPNNESERLAALYRYHILDTPPEIAFERVVHLAARLFRVPIALVSLVDCNRQWFKASLGVEIAQTPRDLAFCAHAILSERPLIVPDAKADPRFCDSP